jgi:hypothetical protein
MNYLEELFQKKNEYSVAANVQKFKSEYFFNKKTLHLFVEDDDDYHFYQSFASRIYNEYQIYGYSQKGKSKLIETFFDISFDTYSAGRVLFFCDKDYDDLLEKVRPSGDNLFVTESYSIENYLITSEVFKIVLDLGYKHVPDDMIDHLIREMEPWYDMFCARLKIITSWILIYRHDSSNCELDEIKFGDIFVQDKDDFAYIRKVSSTSYDKIMADETISNQYKKRYRRESLKEVLESKTKADPKKFSFVKFLGYYRKVDAITRQKIYLRGKYELWFLLKVFLGKFGSEMKKYNEIAGNHNRIPENREKREKITSIIPVNEATIFKIIPPRMAIPEDVNLFLRRNLATA